MASVSAALAMAMIGTDYRYLGELGAGGGGTVLLARHVPMDRLVAVKAVTASSPSALARLKREGRVLAALDHPSILNVFRLVEDGVVVALITEYLEGGDLDTALDERRLTGRAVIDVLARVGSALQAAHSAGVVHRDVKPTNVLLGPDGRAVLADFGLSRLGGEFRTISGVITGTPLYMAPEQITTPDAEAPALDVYSYGALIYRSLAGRPPFVAPDLKMLAELHLSGIPEPLEVLVPGVPRGVSKVVLGMLAKDPGDRPSLQRVLNALARVEPEMWDALLPDARAAAHPSALPADVAAAGGAQDGTIGGTEGGDEPLSAPSIPSSIGVDSRLLTSIEQPVFRPKRTRRTRQILLVAGGILVGLALGLIVLLML